MQKTILLLSSLFTIVVASLVLSSCKDDEPFVKPRLSFSETTRTVNENAGTIEVDVVLDKAFSEDIIVEYRLAGTATEGSGAQADYEVLDDLGEVEIRAGQTTGSIRLRIIDDSIFEGDETIEITIRDVDNDNIDITNQDEILITITDNDPQLIVSFAITTLTVNEEDGLDEDFLEIDVVLSNPAPTDITVQYEIDGTALDSLFAYNEELPSSFYDYYINGVSGQVIIPNGQTIGKIEIQILSDFRYEPTPETMVFTITQASNGVSIGTNDEITISLEQEDGKVLALLWEPAATDVDMDLFLWFGDDVSELDFLLAIAAAGRTTPREEILFLPSSFPDFAFGLSYIYWGGTKDPLNFEVQFADFTAGTLEPVADRDVFAGVYSLANINKWDQAGGAEPSIAQTFRQVSGQVVDISSPIVIPATGSRMRTQTIPKGVKRMTNTKLQNLYQRY